VAGVCAARGLSGWWIGREIQVTTGPRGVDVTTPCGESPGLPLPLRGAFQRDNLGVAIAAVQRRLGEPLRLGPLRRAVARVRMPGRLEVIADDPLVVLDGAHNPAGVAAMAASLREVVGPRRVVAVVSMLGDKDVAAMIAPLAPVCDRVVATRSSHPRAAAPEVIAHLARLEGIDAEVVEDPFAAVARGRAVAGVAGALLICGSLYLLADVRSALLEGADRATDMLAPEIGRKSR
jgi:dihydrofolate synthase/folylpolyglutamate synthase